MSCLRTNSQGHVIPTYRFDALPDELIDLICRFSREVPTLPPYETRSTWFWEPSSRYLLEMRFPSPSTFLVLRLVSKRLYRIATPFMWETLDVQLQHHADFRENIQANVCNRPWKRSRSSVHILEYVASRPELARLVRILCLRVSSYTFTALSRGETENDLERLIEWFLLRTTSLTAFCIDKADLLTPLAVTTLISYETLRLVDIRTVGFRSPGLQLLAREDLSGIDWFGLSIFNLACKSLKLPKMLKRVSLHCDSMSTFVPNEAVILDSCISVDTIEELSIYDKHGDVALLVSKHFLKALSLGWLAALKELFIDLEWCHASRLSEILFNFQGPNVQKLTVRNLRRMDPQGLSNVISSFPNVRELALSSSTTDIVPAWVLGRFDEYVQALKGAIRLRSLEWDNFALDYFDEEAGDFVTGRFDAKKSRGSEVGLKVLSTLASLESIRMVSFTFCMIDTYEIRRDEHGIYSGYEFHRKDIFPDFEACQELIAKLYK